MHLWWRFFSERLKRDKLSTVDILSAENVQIGLQKMQKNFFSSNIEPGEEHGNDCNDNDDNHDNNDDGDDDDGHVDDGNDDDNNHDNNDDGNDEDGHVDDGNDDDSGIEWRP